MVRCRDQLNLSNEINKPAMKIIEIKVLCGPNIWSGYRKQLIQMKLDLEEDEHNPSDKIQGFSNRLESLIPSLYEHECSEGRPGGFFARVKEGTWFGHIIEHIALELQCLAEMECGYGRTRSTNQAGVYHVVFCYEVEEAGVYAAKAAVRIVEALRDGKEYKIEDDIRELKQIKKEKGMGVSAAALIGEARQRDIPWRRVDDGASIMLGYGKNRKLIKEIDPDTAAAAIIDHLYPAGAPSRIPIVAVTGTNGKTTTTRLIAHIAAHAGHSTGYTTTDGIYINGHMIHQGDCSGPSSAVRVLKDPAVDYAVLECARGGILRSGLGFDKCNAGVVTNVTDDHLGLGDINSLHDLANVKAVVANSVADDGYAILNADDDRVYEMRRKVDSKVALFSTDNNNPRIINHCKNGGLASVVKDGYFVIRDAMLDTRILKIHDVPLTLNGRSQCMIKNVLPAILAAWTTGISNENIIGALRSFEPSPEMAPGRMNIFRFKKFQLMIDYAHNNDGFKELGQFLNSTPSSMRIGIIGCPGDRRNEDIRNMGALAARMFDKIIIRHDDDGRGRTNDEITDLLKEGIRGVNSRSPVKVISNEIDAIRYAIDMAPEEAFIIVTSEKIYKSIEFVTAVLEREKSFTRQTGVRFKI